MHLSSNLTSGAAMGLTEYLAVIAALFLFGAGFAVGFLTAVDRKEGQSDGRS